MDKDTHKAQIVSIARRWVGTAYSHQASLEGVGADCLGLFRGVWREIFGREPVDYPDYSGDWNVAGERALLDGASSLLHPLEKGEQGPGDVVLFRMKEGGSAVHLGILAQNRHGHTTFIHSYTHHGVVESAFTSSWIRRAHSFFAIPIRSS